VNPENFRKGEETAADAGRVKKKTPTSSRTNCMEFLERESSVGKMRGTVAWKWKK